MCVCVYVFCLKCPIKIADTLSPYFSRIPYKSQCNPSCNAISLPHGCCLFYIFFIYFYFCSLPNFVFYFSFALRLVLQRILFVVCFFFRLSASLPTFSVSHYIRCDVRNFTFFLFLLFTSLCRFFHRVFRFRRIFHAKFHVLQIFIFPLQAFVDLFFRFFFNRELVCFKLKCYAIFVSTV